MNEGFGARLAHRIHDTSALCMGIDPSRQTLVAWGLSDDVVSMRAFCATMLDATQQAGVGIVKPQSAYFERLGWQGVQVLAEICQQARSADLVVILDAKRGDIGSTCEGYAQAYLAPDAPIKADALTVNPFLGLDTLGAFIVACDSNDAGVFLLCRTSNPGAGAIQGAQTSGSTLSETVKRYALARNATGAQPGPVGLVVGATVTGQINLAGFNGPVLAPGLGAQGGTMQALLDLGVDKGQLVIPVSRHLSGLGPDAGRIAVMANQLMGDLTLAGL